MKDNIAREKIAKLESRLDHLEQDNKLPTLSYFERPLFGCSGIHTIPIAQVVRLILAHLNLKINRVDAVPEYHELTEVVANDTP